MRYFIRYFLRGLLLVAPIGVTVYILWAAIAWLDELLPLGFPGAGLLIILGSVTVTGYLGSTFIARPLFSLLEASMSRLPLVNVLYSSLKDLFSAFVGEKKKFTHPVLVTLNRESQLCKLGFITQTDLAELGMAGKVAVYLPHSYNFSGDLYIVPAENVTPVDASGTVIMKFIVSGGVTHV
jgi:uncharacterized membrane protein